jgi:hypothetical protein
MRPLIARYRKMGMDRLTAAGLARVDLGLEDCLCCHPSLPSEKRVRPIAQCGTRAGYQRHLDRGEATCDPCKAAHAAAMRDYWQAKQRAAR